jgi:predicted nucleotidyltransferase
MTTKHQSDDVLEGHPFEHLVDDRAQADRIAARAPQLLAEDAARPARVGPIGRRLRRHRDEILEIADRYGAHDVRAFGSVARGDDRAASDLDLLVRLGPSPRPTLLRVGGLAEEISAVIRCPVDVSTAALLRPETRAEMLSEAVRV